MRYSPRLLVILQALLVTFLWSTSWVVIKRYIHEIPPLTFAGLRYTLAFLILLPGMLRHRASVGALSRRDWRRLFLLGLVLYTMTQGGQFFTLRYLEATSFSLILSFTTLVVAVFGIVVLQERPSALQWLGMAVFAVGALLYFAPFLDSAATTQDTSNDVRLLGYLLAGFTVCANSLAAVLGRSVNRDSSISRLVVTVVNMGAGALALLTIGAELLFLQWNDRRISTFRIVIFQRNGYV